MPEPTPKQPRTDAPPRTTATPAADLARLAIDAILDKKGREVAVLDLRGISGVADLFVIATSDSDVQTRAIADAVQQKIREEANERPWKKEGLDSLKWVLLDYVDVVVHVFDEEKRAYYDLERLWGDAPSEDVPDGYARIDILDYTPDA
jgi:ribosome-associated protein